MFTTESHPFDAVYVYENVVALLADPPQGSEYELHWHTFAVRLLVKIGLIERAMFTTESHPFAAVYVCEYVPAVLADPPQGSEYELPWQTLAVLLFVNIGLIESAMFTTESHPFDAVY